MRTPPRPAATARNRLFSDRLLTIGLLGLGLYNVVTGIPRFLDYQGFAQQFLDSAGVTGTFTNVAQGQQWGLAAAILFGVLWFATAALSTLQLRRGRLAFWIPLVGAVVAGIVVGFCLIVPLVGDPVFAQLIEATPTPTP